MNAHRKAAWILWLPALGAVLLLLLRPETASAGAMLGVSQCCQTVIPALFPFLVLTGILLRLPRPRRAIKRVSRLFRYWFRLPVGTIPVFLLGLVSGYPVGAAAAAQQYAAGTLSKEDAQRAIPLCNYCGPGFLLSVVGTQVLHDNGLALRLLGLQTLCAVCFAVLCGIGKPVPAESPSITKQASFSFPHAFTDAVCSGGAAVLKICAYVVFFSAISAFLPEIPLLRGVLELTSGLTLLRGASQKTMLTAAFLTGFGGLSVVCQVLAVAQDTGLTARRYLLLKCGFGVLFAAFSLPALKSLRYLFLPLLICIPARKIADMVEKQRKTGYNRFRGDKNAVSQKNRACLCLLYPRPYRRR